MALVDLIKPHIRDLAPYQPVEPGKPVEELEREPVWPTDANFMLALAGPDTGEQLMDEGIIVRPLAGFGMPDHIRISVGLPEENERPVKTLRKLREVHA